MDKPKNGLLTTTILQLIQTALIIMLFAYVGYILPFTIEKLDRGYDKIIQTQELQNASNTKNLASFIKLFGKIDRNAEKAVSIESNVIGNLSDHRHIANMTRDATYDKLDIVIHLLNNSQMNNSR